MKMEFKIIHDDGRIMVTEIHGHENAFGPEMTPRKMQEEQDKWARANFGPNNTDWVILGIGEEVGELMHSHLKRAQGIRGTKEQHDMDGKDAIGDMFIYMLDYCTGMDWDFWTIACLTWAKVKSRDWRKDPVHGGEDQMHPAAWGDDDLPQIPEPVTGQMFDHCPDFTTYHPGGAVYSEEYKARLAGANRDVDAYQEERKAERLSSQPSQTEHSVHVPDPGIEWHRSGQCNCHRPIEGHTP